MLFPYAMTLFILIHVTVTKNNAGSAIFYKHAKGECWSNDDIVKLRARRAFERLIPPQVNPEEVDTKFIRHVLRYFKKALHSMDNVAQPHTLTLLKEAVSDTIGAHLRSEILPAVRFSYYAGYIPYRNAREIHDFYDDIKAYLNTQGLGWIKPKRTHKWSNLTVAKILIGAGTFFNPCACLITKRDSNNCIHLPGLKQDNDREPSAIVLPFKSGGLVSLNSPESSNALLKYYTAASRCILSSSPKKCRHADFVSFNNELWHWMKRDVAPNLVDEKLYTAYGGILRIAAAVQNYGKGLSRRNLFEYEDSGFSKWYPWRALTQSYVYVNADWTPQVYVGLVIMTAVTIYLLLICYGYIFGDSSGCNCGRSSSVSPDNTNARVETSTVMPHQSTVNYSDKVRYEKVDSKTASLGSIRKQKVYDLNENTEKLMSVQLSSEDTSVVSTSSRSSSEDEAHVETTRAKSKSPPRLETSISELTIDRNKISRLQMPYTSSQTDTLTRYHSPRGSESVSSGSVSSGSESSLSSRSGSSTTKSGSSRDLSWARKVISKHSLRTTSKSLSRTDEHTSCTTPNSR